jgi:predicted MFS family arabinose efflux permease
LLVLCAAPFADELASGVPTLGAADIRAELGLSYGAAALTLLSIPLLLGLLVESPLLLIARRLGRRRLVAAGFVGMALGTLAAAASVTAWQLALALASAGSAGGVALALLETAIMDAAPTEREHWMTRWTIAATVGDLAAPGLIALAVWTGFGWRGAFVAAALMTLATAAFVPRRMPADDAAATEHGRTTVRAALRRAFGNRRLLLWCAGIQACGLLDEILIVVAMLFLTEVRGASIAVAALVLTALPAAGALGLIVTEGALRRVEPLRWLGVNCAICAGALVGFATTAHLGAAVAFLAVIGFTAAPMWPIATAQSYRALPEDSTAVAAVANLYAPLGVALPVAIAAAADSFGLVVAILLLGAQPASLAALSWLERRTGR